MLVEMITAEEARNAVKINIINDDLKQVKKFIDNAVISHKSHCIFIDDVADRSGGDFKIFLKNRELTFKTLKELGYIIRQCPNEDHAPVFVVQWENDYIEDPTDMTNRLNWPEI